MKHKPDSPAASPAQTAAPALADADDAADLLPTPAPANALVAEPGPEPRGLLDDYHERPFDPAAPFSPALCARANGWTADRQRGFLAAIAEGHTVEAAAAQVGMSATSAYDLRNRAAGAGFALGWQAANLLARNRLGDVLVSRAFDGVTDSWTRADGETVTRHRHDNRLGMAMLSRLDRLADRQVSEGTHHAARIVAQEWEAFLDLIGGDANPARAGLFLGVRAGQGEPEAELAAIVGLARADRYLRAHAGLAAEVDCADLDPANRASWTAGQWLRAEAAGLVALAPAGEPEEDDGSSQLTQVERDQIARGPVWWDDVEEDWRTSFPAPEAFDGFEECDYGRDDYERALTPEERAAVESEEAEIVAEMRAEGMRDRDEWLAALAKRAANDPAGDNVEANVGDDAPK